jgi:hypothetical protein
MSTVPNEPAEVVRLDLSAGYVHATLVKGEPHVVLKPAIDELGLAYAAQLRKLKTRSWATVAQTDMVAEDGRVREMATVPVRTFLMLLANVNENRVRDEIRPILIAFQNETADAIEAYWSRGQSSAQQPTAEAEYPTTVSWDQAAAIARIQYGLDVDTTGLRDLLSKGGILTKDLRPHRKWEHLFWPLANRWEIHSSVLPQLIRFAAKVRRELAAAEQDLQMSLPLPMSGLIYEEAPARNRPPALGGSVLPMPRRSRDGA